MLCSHGMHLHKKFCHSGACSPGLYSFLNWDILFKIWGVLVQGFFKKMELWAKTNSFNLMSQCFLNAFHPTCNLISSTLYLKKYFYLMLYTIPPDLCNISHHIEQKELRYSTETACCSSLECSSDTAQHPAPSVYLTLTSCS